MMKQLIIFFGISISSQLFAEKAPRLLPAQRRDLLQKGRVVRLRKRQGNEQNLAPNVLVAIIPERAVGGGVIASHGAGSEKPST